MQFRCSIYYSYCKGASSMQRYMLRLVITVDVTALCNHWTVPLDCTTGLDWTGLDWTSVLTFAPKIALKK